LLCAASVDAGDGGREMSGTPRRGTDMDVSRRGFMQCMAWAGTGVLWTAAGGVLSSCSLANQQTSGDGTFSFAQISDTHAGFGGPGRGTVRRQGWRSFDYRGVHFVGLVNVLQYKADGVGNLGGAQLEWLEKDLAPLGASTPIVVYSHVPLWAVYPQWGWVTGD